MTASWSNIRRTVACTVKRIVQADAVADQDHQIEITVRHGFPHTEPEEVIRHPLVFASLRCSYVPSTSNLAGSQCSPSHEFLHLCQNGAQPIMGSFMDVCMESPTPIVKSAGPLVSWPLLQQCCAAGQRQWRQPIQMTLIFICGRGHCQAPVACSRVANCRRGRPCRVSKARRGVTPARCASSQDFLRSSVGKINCMGLLHARTLHSAVQEMDMQAVSSWTRSSGSD
eukprot:362135-Chlamydomonas_euryale.AAC.7